MPQKLAKKLKNQQNTLTTSGADKKIIPIVPDSSDMEALIYCFEVIPVRLYVQASQAL